MEISNTPDYLDVDCLYIYVSVKTGIGKSRAFQIYVRESGCIQLTILIFLEDVFPIHDMHMDVGLMRLFRKVSRVQRLGYCSVGQNLT